MTTVTIPRKLAQKGDLVLVPRKEYEELLRAKRIKEFMPTVAQKRALVRAQKNFGEGKTLSYHEFAKRLGFRN